MAAPLASAFTHQPPTIPLCSFAAVGVPPAVMGIGPAVAIPAAVEMAGLSLDDIDVYEINEAFASQVGRLSSCSVGWCGQWRGGCPMACLRACLVPWCWQWLCLWLSSGQREGSRIRLALRACTAGWLRLTQHLLPLPAMRACSCSLSPLPHVLRSPMLLAPL